MTMKENNEVLFAKKIIKRFSCQTIKRKLMHNIHIVQIDIFIQKCIIRIWKC